MNFPGEIWLIPVPISEEAPERAPEAELADAVKNCQIFIVEKGKTARKWLKWLDPEFSKRNVLFVELNKHGATAELKETLLKTEKHIHIGLMSEAGCPGIADPGAEVVALAHQMGIRVRPLVGVSSITLALMGSGLSSQRFCFHSYLPVKTPDLKRAIHQLEIQSAREKSIQLFIETPYRNEAMLQCLLETLQANTLLCLAIGLQTPGEKIIRLPVSDWKKRQKPELHKIPCVFLLLAGQ
jgi:16S rRNA (cytidine1402-2'-O)-methyltransferase